VDAVNRQVALSCRDSETAYSVTFANLLKKYHWSHDRKAWFTFTGEPVAP